ASTRRTRRRAPLSSGLAASSRARRVSRSPRRQTASCAKASDMSDKIVTPVTIMLGAAKKSGKALKPNPTKAKPAMIPTPMEHVFKAPSHEERMPSEAAHEHVRATGDYVAGRISSKKYADIKNRAHKIMSKTPKAKR